MCLRDVGAKTFGSSNGEQKGHYRAGTGCGRRTPGEDGEGSRAAREPGVSCSWERGMESRVLRWTQAALMDDNVSLRPLWAWWCRARHWATPH